jgi:hypothetical protein
MGDIQRDPYEWTEPRDWLGFAGIPAARFPSISREEHFAQKLHAYTLHRGDRTNTRVKDLIDLVLLIDAGMMDQERLKRDIVDTFHRRQTHQLPSKLESPPEFWEVVFMKLAVECQIDSDIKAQFDKVARYCDGIL